MLSSLRRNNGLIIALRPINIISKNFKLFLRFLMHFWQSKFTINNKLIIYNDFVNIKLYFYFKVELNN